jgi:membrane protease YdiL (CAAX protease family)
LSDAEIQPEHPHRSHSLFLGPAGLRPGWGLLLFAALFFGLLKILAALVHTLHRRAGRSHEQSLTAVLLGDGVPFVAVLLATWIMSRIERRPLSAYGFSTLRALPYFAAGLGWGFVFLSALVLLLKALGLLVFDSRLLFGAAAIRYGALWLAGFLLVACVEEAVLRGYLQLTLARALASLYKAMNATRSDALGFWTAAFLLSLLFGLGHGSNPGESPIGLLSAGVAGLVFCLSLWRTGSLWWAIGFHATWDWAQSFLYGVADSGTMVQHHLFATHAVGRPILSGGTTGPEGSLYILPIMLAIALAILFTLSRRTDVLAETRPIQPTFAA